MYNQFTLLCTRENWNISAISVSKDDSHQIAALQCEPVRPKETQEGEEYQLSSRHQTTAPPYS